MVGAMTSVRRCHLRSGKGNILQQRSFHSGTRERRFLPPNLLRNHALIKSVTVISLTGLGFCTLSSRRPLRADAPRNLRSSDDLSPVSVQEARRAAHSKAKESGKNYSSNEPDFTSEGEQKPPPQTTSSEVNEKKDSNSWNDFTSKVSSIQWGSISEKIKNIVVPQWLSLFPAFMTKFQNELSMAPGSLAEEIWREANDPEVNPEIIWDANVRVSDDLCSDEKAFLAKRKDETRRALAKFLGIKESEIHSDDVPIIAMCGSGGGLRALVAGAGSYIASKEAGLFDCITYTAGVSGSCWLQTLYFSSMGRRDHAQIIRHLKNRLGVHLAYPPAAFNLISSAPTNKFLLTGLVEKLKGAPDSDFGTVDIYGMLLASRLLIPKAELAIDADDLKMSTQQDYIRDGQAPLPIYTAVRHEIPVVASDNLTAEEVKEKAKKEAWFQWFEFTPFEFWCEEMGAVPIWAMGRQFQQGKTVWRENGLSLPETRVPMLLGIWGSAFCATLSHYYKEIRPVMKGLAGFGGIDQIIAERDQDLIKVHPIDPAAIPNFAVGMEGMLPQSCPESLYSTPFLQLMDAGMSNNLPIYPLLRPGRNVDVVIAFDNSADVKTDNWLKVVDGYARQRNITGWPIGAGWPPANKSQEQTTKELNAAQATSEADAEAKVREAQKDDATGQVKRPPGYEQGDLGYCNVWVGTTAERKADGEPPPSKLLDHQNWDVISKEDAGITVVYFPLLANDNVPGVDPKTSDYLSTWNFVYTPEQIDNVVELARANFQEGKEQTRRTVLAVYERKKKLRQEREREAKEWRLKRKLRSGIPRGRKLGEADHGDHFS